MGSFDIKEITPRQLKAARALLGWSAVDAAKAAKLGVATVRRAELEGGLNSLTPRNLESLVEAFKEAGLQFYRSGNDVGVTLRAASIDKEAPQDRF